MRNGNNQQNESINKYEMSQTKAKVDKFKSDIREKFHQQYFRKMRSQMEEELSSNPSKNNNNSFHHEDQQMGQQAQSNRKYCIKLNNQKMLYPQNMEVETNTEVYLSPNRTRSPKIEKINENHSLSQLHIAELADLYNSIQTNKPQIQKMETLISKIIEQIEWRINTLYCISAERYTEENWSMNISALYEEHYSILFLLFIIYKEIQNQLMKSYTQKAVHRSRSYRIRLQYICNKNSVGREMLAKFGLLKLKAIEYSEN